MQPRQRSVDEANETVTISPGQRPGRRANAMISLAGLVAVAAVVMLLKQQASPAPAAASETTGVARFDIDAPPPPVPLTIKTGRTHEVLFASTPMPSVTPASRPEAGLHFSKNGQSSISTKSGQGTQSTGPLRIAGENYFVLRSTRDRAEAEKLAQTALAKGVLCHVEGSLPGFSGAGWWSVVADASFNLPTDRAALEREFKRLTALGYKPSAYRWR